MIAELVGLGEEVVEPRIGTVGTTSDSVVREWRDRDTMLYALGVGAGVSDPGGFELEFTTENSKGVAQRVLPTYASLLSPNLKGVIDWSGIDRSKLVHGDQSVTLFSELPCVGSVAVATTLLGVLDKGSGCLLALQTDGRDVSRGDLVFTARMGLFIRGAGGFGGPKELDGDAASALAAQPIPSRVPDEAVTYVTRTDQALLYRLSGDRNPLHSDPTFATRAGFAKPILHGLCTYGFTGRGLLHSLCGSDPRRFDSISGRFSKPVYPGDALTISMWDVSDQAPGVYRFRTSTQGGDVVIDAGVFRVRDDDSGDEISDNL
jgi:acyl dehydratase